MRIYDPLTEFEEAKKLVWDFVEQNPPMSMKQCMDWIDTELESRTRGNGKACPLTPAIEKLPSPLPLSPGGEGIRREDTIIGRGSKVGMEERLAILEDEKTSASLVEPVGG